MGLADMIRKVNKTVSVVAVAGLLTLTAAPAYSQTGSERAARNVDKINAWNLIKWIDVSPDYYKNVDEGAERAAEEVERLNPRNWFSGTNDQRDGTKKLEDGLSFETMDNVVSTIEALGTKMPSRYGEESYSAIIDVQNGIFGKKPGSREKRVFNWMTGLYKITVSGSKRSPMTEISIEPYSGQNLPRVDIDFSRTRFLPEIIRLRAPEKREMKKREMKKREIITVTCLLTEYIAAKGDSLTTVPTVPYNPEANDYRVALDNHYDLIVRLQPINYKVEILGLASNREQFKEGESSLLIRPPEESKRDLALIAHNAFQDLGSK